MQAKVQTAMFEDFRIVAVHFPRHLCRLQQEEQIVSEFLTISSLALGTFFLLAFNEPGGMSWNHAMILSIAVYVIVSNDIFRSVDSGLQFRLSVRSNSFSGEADTRNWEITFSHRCWSGQIFSWGRSAKPKRGFQMDLRVLGLKWFWADTGKWFLLDGKQANFWIFVSAGQMKIFLFEFSSFLFFLSFFSNTHLAPAALSRRMGLKSRETNAWNCMLLAALGFLHTAIK